LRSQARNGEWSVERIELWDTVILSQTLQWLEYADDVKNPPGVDACALMSSPQPSNVSDDPLPVSH
jgi:hypothetical protein